MIAENKKLNNKKNNKATTGGYRVGDGLRKPDGTNLIIYEVVCKGDSQWPYAWVKAVDADGGGEEPTKEQAAAWKLNYEEHGFSDKPVPTFRQFAIYWYAVPPPPMCAWRLTRPAAQERTVEEGGQVVQVLSACPARDRG